MKDYFVNKIQGPGDLTFVLIHNAGGSHKFFTHQIEFLTTLGSVVILDLPGHGLSKTTNDFSVAGNARFIIDICNELKLNKICLIGLNNGATIALDLALKGTLQLFGLILIDPPIFMDQAFIEEINNFIASLDHSSVEEFAHVLANSLFIETSEINRKLAFKAFCQANKLTLQQTFKELLWWDKHTAKNVANLTLPILCIMTDGHHCSYQKLNQFAPNFTLAQVVGSKCWATLEVPEQINAMVTRFVKVYTI